MIAVRGSESFTVIHRAGPGGFTRIVSGRAIV